MEESQEPDDSDENQEEEVEEEDEGQRQELQAEILRQEKERREKMKALLNEFLLVQLQKGVERSLLNERKVMIQWFHPFHKAHLKECQFACKKLALVFNKTLDIQLSMIQAIHDEYKEAGRLQDYDYLQHLHTSDELLDFLRTKCEEIQQQYVKEGQVLQKYYFSNELETMARSMDEAEKIKNLAQLQKSIQEKTADKTTDQYKAVLVHEELQNRREEELIRYDYDRCIETMWKVLHEAILKYEETAKGDQALFKEYKKRHDVCVSRVKKVKKEIQSLSAEILKLQENLQREQAKLEQVKLMAEKKLEGKLNELYTIKKQSKVKSMGPSVSKLISDSEVAVSFLKSKSQKAVKIEKLKAICDNLETMHKKSYMESPMLDFNEMDSFLEKYPLEEMEFDFEELPEVMENIQRKTGYAVLQNIALQHEIDKLLIDNMALKSNMKKYINAIANGDYERIPEPPSSIQEAALLSF